MLWIALLSINLWAAPLKKSVEEVKCYTKNDMKAGVCWALCRQDGFDTGSYNQKTDDCFCSNRRKFKEVSEVAIKVPSTVRMTETKTERVYTPYWQSDDSDE